MADVMVRLFFFNGEFPVSLEEIAGNGVGGPGGDEGLMFHLDFQGAFVV